MKRHHSTLPGYARQSDGARRFATAGLLSLALLLTACGGGGDTSSGGGTASDTGIAGTYGGLASGSISAPGVTIPVSGSVTFVIDAAGNVTYDPGQPYSSTVALGGSSFSVSAPLNVVDSRCTGTMDLHGTVSGGMISGTIGSTGVGCLGVSATVSGSFSASKIAKAPSRSRYSLMNSVGDAMGGLR